MPKDSKFKPGQSGNPQTMFKPGNRYRWKPGESGNPAGRASKCPRLEHVLRASLMDEGATAESASLLLEGARNREPWAVELLLQHLISLMTPEMKATSGNNGRTTGPVPLGDATVEQKLSLAADATTTPQSDFQTLKQPTLASDGSSRPQWRDYNIPRSPMGPGELASTVKAEPVPSTPRPGRAVAPPALPTAPPRTLPPRLDPNERTKGSALYRQNNPPGGRIDTSEIGRYIVVENDKRGSLAKWGNDRLGRK